MQIYLNIAGDDLDPVVLSAALGGQPHQAACKGDAITHTNVRGRQISRPAIAGYWQRMVAFDSPASADAAAQDLLAGLTGDATIWHALGSRFRVGITVHEVPSHSTPQTLFDVTTLALFENTSGCRCT